MSITGAEIRRVRLAMEGASGEPMTQEEFAGLLGTTANTVARWERDEMAPRGPAEFLIQRLAAEHGIRARVTKKAAKKR